MVALRMTLASIYLSFKDWRAGKVLLQITTSLLSRKRRPEFSCASTLDAAAGGALIVDSLGALARGMLHVRVLCVPYY